MASVLRSQIRKEYSKVKGESSGCQNSEGPVGRLLYVMLCPYHFSDMRGCVTVDGAGLLGPLDKASSRARRHGVKILNE